MRLVSGEVWSPPCHSMFLDNLRADSDCTLNDDQFLVGHVNQYGALISKAIFFRFFTIAINISERLYFAD